MLLSEPELQVQASGLFLHVQFARVIVLFGHLIPDFAIVAELIAKADALPGQVGAKAGIKAVAIAKTVLGGTVLDDGILDECALNSVTDMEIKMQSDIVDCRVADRRKGEDRH